MATLEDAVVNDGNGTTTRLFDTGSNKYIQPIIPLAGPQEVAVREWGSDTSLITTGLDSLATSTTVGVASAEVDATSLYADDIVIYGKFQMTTSGSPTGYVDAFCIWSLDGGTDYTGDTTYSGSAAGYTLGAAGSPNLDWLFSVKPHANTGIYRGGASLKARLGFVPPFFAIVVLNNSAIALHTSGSEITYRARY